MLLVYYPNYIEKQLNLMIYVTEKKSNEVFCINISQFSSLSAILFLFFTSKRLMILINNIL